MTPKELRDKANEFLNPLGYSVHSSSGDQRTLTYTNDKENSAAIRVFLDNQNEPKMKIYGVGFFFIEVTTSSIQFNHPRLSKYLHVINRTLELMMEEFQ